MMRVETRHKPLIGKDVFVGGFDAVYDCIGSPESFSDALSLSRGRGKITLVGTHAYSKKERWQGKELSTHELLIELIQKHPDYPLAQLVTHEFPLEEYKEAIVANIERGKYKSIKTLLKI